VENREKNKKHLFEHGKRETSFPSSPGDLPSKQKGGRTVAEEKKRHELGGEEEAEAQTMV